MYIVQLYICQPLARKAAIMDHFLEAGSPSAWNYKNSPGAQYIDQHLFTVGILFDLSRV
jgi:hypothetical protein